MHISAGHWGNPELTLGCIALIGALAGFLLFNCFPARVFMGDTGSLALGGAVAAISILTGTEFFMVIMGRCLCGRGALCGHTGYLFQADEGEAHLQDEPHSSSLCSPWGGMRCRWTTRFCIVGSILTLMGVWLYTIR